MFSGGLFFKMKLILLFVGVVVLLGLIVGGVYFFYSPAITLEKTTIEKIEPVYLPPVRSITFVNGEHLTIYGEKVGGLE
jgi:hypothetical protein